ncbi:Hint domain-containing protein, partial [Microbaculum marinum]
MPQQFGYAFILRPTGVVGSLAAQTVTITDISDGADDNLTILGDISEDEFTSNKFLQGFTFLGVATIDDHKIIVGEVSGGGLIGFTDTNLATGTPFTYDSNASYQFVCFAAGTLIGTPGGDVPVEELSEGDIVVTASGEERAIRWTGTRTVDCRKTTNPRQAWPVRVSAHAFGHGLPERELWLSAAHAVQVSANRGVGEDVLVPIGALVNGATITQVPVETIDYHHIELDSHDVVMANGLPAESYLDCGNRAFFLGADVAPEFERESVDPATLPFCLPFVTGGEVVEEIRAQLDARARRLGWSAEEIEHDIAIEVGGFRVVPQDAGGRLQFTLPSDAGDAWLVSSSWVPVCFGCAMVCAGGRSLGPWSERP